MVRERDSPGTPSTRREYVRYFIRNPQIYLRYPRSFPRVCDAIACGGMPIQNFISNVKHVCIFVAHALYEFAGPDVVRL